MPQVLQLIAILLQIYFPFSLTTVLFHGVLFSIKRNNPYHLIIHLELFKFPNVPFTDVARVLKQFLSSYLDNNCLNAAHVCLPWCMLLHGLARCLHCDQDTCVGCNNNAAWKDVAADEQRHGVRTCWDVLIGQAPVNTAGGSIRLWSILSPVNQWGAGKQQGIDPSTSNEQASMKRVKPVSCENRVNFVLFTKVNEMCKCHKCEYVWRALSSCIWY